MPYGQGFEIDCQYLLILNAFITKNNMYANFSSSSSTTTTTNNNNKHTHKKVDISQYDYEYTL